MTNEAPRPSSARDTLLRVFLGFLAVTAAIAGIAVLAGEFGETVVKILVTTITISFASVGAMACSVFAERRPDNPMGSVGMVVAALAAILIIVGAWAEVGSEGYWKSTASLSLAAASFAHAFLLLLPKLDAQYRAAQRVSTVLIATLLVLLVLAIWKEIDSSGYFRVVGVVSIGVGLLTLGIPIAWKLSKGEGSTVAGAADGLGATLTLRRLADGAYEDGKGTRYRVTREER